MGNSTVLKPERLDRILANSGLGSRKQVKRIIHSGSVTVNGATVRDDSFKAVPGKDTIAVDGKELDVRADAYFMLNKPADYVCATKDGLHSTVLDLFKSDNHKYLGGTLSPVGRLDIDTEGLLIVTSDGVLNHRLTSPAFHVPKTYLVHLKDSADEETRRLYTQRLSQGIHIPPEGNEKEADCLPAELEWSGPENSCVITIYEGKYHEIKRMFRALGNEVTYLKRLSMGSLSLDPDLKPGEYRPLTEEELNLLEKI
ncbi:MAG: rRNA pseudouridine synthase [Treponema sp.]|nr:rRNA pseudouridine synthase [Treponema sp.]